MIATVDLRVPGPAAVDAGLQEAGFPLVTGHGVDAALRAEPRAAARRFFALPATVKRAYAVGVGGRGWLPLGVGANGAVEGPDPDGGEHPPDLKESFAIGPGTPTGDAAVDAVWLPPDVWPAEVPELQALASRYLAR